VAQAWTPNALLLADFLWVGYLRDSRQYWCNNLGHVLFALLESYALLGSCWWQEIWRGSLIVGTTYSPLLRSRHHAVLWYLVIIAHIFAHI